MKTRLFKYFENFTTKKKQQKTKKKQLKVGFKGIKIIYFRDVEHLRDVTQSITSFYCDA